MSIFDDDFEKILRDHLETIFYSLIKRMNKEGASGTLFKIYSNNDDEPRVVKVYIDPIDNANRETYLNDAKKLKKYQHNNIVKAYDAGQINYRNEKYFYIILEYIKGPSLDEIDPKVFWETSYKGRINLLTQALEAVDAFRKEYDIHNDLHLGNLLYSEKKITIIDFGPSRLAHKFAETDYDLYAIKNELITFFLKSEEIENIFKDVTFSTIDFKELKQIIIDEEQKISRNEESVNKQIDTNSLLRIQAFYNRMASFLKNMAKGTLTSTEIKETVAQFKVSDEKVYFGIEITQRNRGYNNKLDFINQKYILIISSDLSSTRKNLKKNNKSINLMNFSNVVILLQEMKDFIMQTYGLQINIPDNIPLCEVELKIDTSKILGKKWDITKHLQLSIKNNNNYRLKIVKSGIESRSMIFYLSEEPIIDPMDKYNYPLIAYAEFKNQLKNTNIEKPYILRGYAKLDTGEVFFSEKTDF